MAGKSTRRDFIYYATGGVGTVATDGSALVGGMPRRSISGEDLNDLVAFLLK